MRSSLAVSAVLAGFLLAGCGSGADGALPEQTGTPAPEPTAEEPARTAPAKSVAVADQCSLLTPDQLSALGFDQQPRARESQGVPGCQFEAGEPGSPGWGAFVAADQRTMQDFLAAGRGAVQGDLGGYPTAQVDNGSGCLLSIDVSDSGSLFVNAIVRPGADPEVGSGCDAATRVAEAAIANLPNA